jgi:hypothetical protein
VGFLVRHIDELEQIDICEGMSLSLKGLPAGLDRPDSGNMKQAFVTSFVSYVFYFFTSVLNILLEFKVLSQLL